MKMKNNLIPLIMLLQVIVAAVLLLIAIKDNCGLIKYVYITLLVCVLSSSTLIFIVGYKPDK